jgi:large subunit ribosomal protein L24
MKIKKGDKVIVIAGKERRAEGKVVKAMPDKDMVIIEGINLRKRHQRARRSGEKGQVVEIASPIHVSNVMLIDAKTGKGTRHPKRS